MTDFLADLNEPQQKAVKAVDGAVLVIAGAGSGKTRVLTYRIAHLLNLGIDPFNILALTFTNKAAKEMKDRIAQLVGGSKAKSLWMGTFHSVFAKILRFEAEKIEYPSNFTIYDADDSKRLLKNIIKEQNLDDKIYNAGAVLSRISNAKNNLISAPEYNEDFEIQTYDAQSRKPKLGMIYSIYQQRLKKAAAMDFDDLLFNTNILLRDHADVLYKYQNKFKYILVDEYQDTNFSQYLIVKKLAANNENICVVGDDAQSIYAFRGANIQNILNFKSDYPEHKIFKLEQNYRSTKNIVNAANSVIANNKDQIKKVVWTDNESGEKIQLFKASSESEEAALIGSRIFELKKNNEFSDKDFAILYRTNYQSRALEEALRKLNIPYKIYGGVSFYQRKEIKDLLAYFRLVLNPSDETSFLRIINFPARGIGNTTLDRLVVAANENNSSIWEVAQKPAAFNVQLNSGIINRLNEFVLMIKSFKARANNHNAFEFGKMVAYQSGIIKFYNEDESPESVTRRENIEELISALKDFSEAPGDVEGENALRTIDVFLEEISLLTDSEPEKTDRDDVNRVSLMTMHAAKGLEFPVVFLAGMEENLFPSHMSLQSRTELEEERRLFYVALTRGMKKVFLSYAETRFRFGEFNFCEHSRFIDEIDEQFINVISGNINKPKDNSWLKESFSESRKQFKPINKISSAPSATQEDSDAGFVLLTAAQLRIDMVVQHQRFGIGKIKTIEGAGENAKASVVFNNFGQKQLLLKYAKLKILS
ncbi:MAG: UvrD-helicase domain-containing protein [Bacteroidetes bacterium]|nr:UvrD-helicase domain-containing protein [Bacteroidota bacterium]